MWQLEIGGQSGAEVPACLANQVRARYRSHTHTLRTSARMKPVREQARVRLGRRGAHGQAVARPQAPFRKVALQGGMTEAVLATPNRQVTNWASGQIEGQKAEEGTQAGTEGGTQGLG